MNSKAVAHASDIKDNYVTILEKKLEIAVKALRDISVNKKKDDWKSFSESVAYCALDEIEKLGE